MLRLDPNTGAAMAGNPLAGSADPNARRIVAHGLRNPFRMTVRPGTSEVWLGDVGWSTWEELNRIPSPTSEVTNFGWPCYEGSWSDAGGATSALSWSLHLNHCDSGGNCHQHPVQSWPQVASGSFSAPDHEYPSYRS